ncbi:MAG TPA: type II toxin-antitoxin system CcdA family antitoxin [Rhizomicrobium sp.]|jgi:antitoxin CcdA|nr:type II toxin-antitoxin system CcdA family antitoxin [Rhizomicrobium sp.]
MTKVNDMGYLWHRAGSIKGRIHKEFDENGLAGALALGEKIRRQTGGETPKESTIRSWVSFWKNHPGFRSGAHYRAARDSRDQDPVGATAANKVSEGFAEETRSFRDERVRPSRKVSTPVDIDEGLLMESKAMDISLSHVLEEELSKRVKAQRGRRWTEENKEFIDSYNAYIERNGVFGEDLLDLDDSPV